MAREKTIGIRLSEEEQHALDARADKEDRTRSDMGRLLILEGLGLRGQAAASVAAPSTSTDDPHAVRRSGRTGKHNHPPKGTQ